MSQERYEDIELGRNVTEGATRGAQARATAVLSLRVTAAELAEVEAVGGATGRSISQVIRDAIREHLHHQRLGMSGTITFPSGVTTSMGAGLRESSRANGARTELVPAS